MVKLVVNEVAKMKAKVVINHLELCYEVPCDRVKKERECSSPAEEWTEGIAFVKGRRVARQKEC